MKKSILNFEIPRMTDIKISPKTLRDYPVFAIREIQNHS